MSAFREEPRRLSQSAIWRLQRAYFERQGVEAWRRGIVPHYVTSNPFIARSYARIVLGWLRDRRAGGAPPLETIHLVELGAGCGRFGYQLLRQLPPLLEASSIAPAAIRYVMTDLAEANLTFLRAHPRLKPLIASGVLDFARFDVEQDSELRLLESGRWLSAEAPASALVVIANYVFDSVPQDLFAVAGGQLQEIAVGLESDAAEPALEQLRASYHPRPVAGPGHYGDEALDQLLDAYLQRLPGGTFSIPTATLGCLARLRRLTDDLLVLSADRGPHRLEDLVGAAPPPLLFHGSCSLPVNYHALSASAESAGGQAISSGKRARALTVCALLFGRAGAAAEARAAFREAIEGFGPEELFQLKRSLPRIADRLSPEQLLAHLELGAWDPGMFLALWPPLLDKLKRASAPLRREWRAAAHQIWDAYFPIGEGADLAFSLGVLMGELGFWDDAVTFYAYSLESHGADPHTLFNQSFCRTRAGDLQGALAGLARLLAIEPDHAAALALKAEIEDALR